jgi:hypothetical protein
MMAFTVWADIPNIRQRGIIWPTDFPRFLLPLAFLRWRPRLRRAAARKRIWDMASRMPFVRVYFRETQELVFDAHDKAFVFYGGVCRRGIYDNMKTAVETIFLGKARQYNRRFLQMCSHHLIEPVACSPAAGWEKGQVENQVGNLRDQLFRPKPRVTSMFSQGLIMFPSAFHWILLLRGRLGSTNTGTAGDAIVMERSAREMPTT